jgi:hypothetical protein
MSLSRFEEAVEHRRSADGSPAEAGEYGGEVVAAVEAVFEFGQIARNVLVTDRPIGTDDLVAQRGVDPVEGRREDRLAAGAGADRLVGTAGRGDAAKARQTIANDGAASVQAALGEDLDLGAPEAPPPAQLEAHVADTEESQNWSE